MLALANVQTAEVLKSALMQQRMRLVSSAVNNRDAVSQMQDNHYNLIVIEEDFPELGAADFCRFLRLTNTSMAVAPVIYGIKNAEKKNVLAARDAGASKIVRTPFSASSLIDTLEATVREARPFIQTSSFNGPDRRIAHSGPYSGIERRKGQHGWMSVEEQKRILEG